MVMRAGVATRLRGEFLFIGEKGDFMKTVCACLALLLAIAVGYGQNDRQPQSEIRLVSPNGQRTLTIMARDDIAGLWVSCGKRSTCVLDANGYSVFGIYDDIDKTSNGFDVCLSSVKGEYSLRTKAKND